MTEDDAAAAVDLLIKANEALSAYAGFCATHGGGYRSSLSDVEFFDNVESGAEADESGLLFMDDRQLLVTPRRAAELMLIGNHRVQMFTPAYEAFADDTQDMLTDTLGVLVGVREDDEGDEGGA